MEVNAGNILNMDYILTFGKGAILILLVLYAIFSLIIVRQVDLMNKTLITNISTLIKTFSIMHFIFVLALIMLAWRII